MLDNESSRASDKMKPAPTLLDCTHTFVLSSAPNSEWALFEVPEALAVDASRQRRAHQKSKTGCENCRRRRVKCNEETPCATCARRGERCQRIARRTRMSSVSSIPVSPAPIPRPDTTDVLVNVLHMKLFHHFQSHTCYTLLLTPEIWGHALQLCFEFDFLMSAILCVAARHLAFLQPDDPSYPTTAASHLCRALSRFRQKLDHDFSSTHLDAFVATAILLQYEVWTDASFSSLQDGGGRMVFDPSKDSIFTVSSGLKKVFLKCVPHAMNQPSVFMPHVRYDPRDALVSAAQITDATVAKYHDFFAYDRPFSLSLLDLPVLAMPDSDPAFLDPTSPGPWEYHVPKRHDALDPIEDGYKPVTTRLCLVLSFLHPSNPIKADSPLLPELARYIFSFPVHCFGPFVSMAQQGDPHAMLLLYHFYRAARILLPSDKCWWAQERATTAERCLKEWMVRECEK